jgi:CDP-diacylglycerol--serine O-phosphatidyltransferase
MAEEKAGVRAGRFKRGAAILPSILTTGNLFFGFWAIIRTIHRDYAGAAVWIILAVLLDVFDGRIARMTGTSSEFGGELDSLADAISFGVAPAVLVYCWGMQTLPRAGWLVAFFFVVGGVMRLARFNVQRHAVDGRYFVGLPIPAAAGQLTAIILFAPDQVTQRPVAILIGAAVLLLAVLMVSMLRYPSFKNVDLKSRRRSVVVLGIAAVFLLIAWRPTWALLAAATAYSLSGLFSYLLTTLRRRGGQSAASPTAAGAGI